MSKELRAARRRLPETGMMYREWRRMPGGLSADDHTPAHFNPAAQDCGQKLSAWPTKGDGCPGGDPRPIRHGRGTRIIQAPIRGKEIIEIALCPEPVERGPAGLGWKLPPIPPTASSDCHHGYFPFVPTCLCAFVPSYLGASVPLPDATYVGWRGGWF
jgi:hypothetical protein